MRRPLASLAFGMLLLALPGAAFAAYIVDGTLDTGYGKVPMSAQTTQTNFGDNGDAAIDLANGSELDLGYAVVSGGVLHLFLSGNLESNFNKLEIFIDSKAGGQNRLLQGNSTQGGFDRMCDDGSGNGLTFDSGFEADYWISPTCGGGPFALYVDYVEVGTGTGYYLGQGGAGGTGTLSGGNAPSGGGSLGIKASIDNSNTGGVVGGCDASSGSGVKTGMELEIPLSAIGDPSEPIKVCAFVNGSSHDFLSNQVLGPLPVGTCNLGEPRNVNFSSLAGDQYFGPGNPVPASTSWMLAVLSLLMLATAGVVLRKRATA